MWRWLRIPPRHLFGATLDVDISMCNIGVHGEDFEDCDGLFDFLHGHSTVENYSMSKALAQRFRAWSFEVTERVSQRQTDLTDLDAVGLELARLLKNESPYRKVQYIDSSGKITVLKVNFF
ncbi:MAG: hypothetical protein ACPGOY_18720 [Rhodospirillaceae bacterium]